MSSHATNHHAIHAATITAVFLAAAVILKLWPDKSKLALIPVAMHGLVSAGLAVRHHRHQVRAISRFNHGMPIKHGHGTHSGHAGGGRGKP